MTDLMEAVTSLAKRRGIAFQSAEIYGGLRSSWDYGPLGVELRRNIRNDWWRANVQLRDDVVGVEAAIITQPSRLAGERPPRDVPRPARRVHELPSALARGPPRGERRRRRALPELRRRRVHRAQAVQPDAQDLPRAGRGRRRRGLPAAGDRAGHVRELPGDPDRRRARSCRSASRRSASRSATRSRRATSSSARASSSRWRWSSSSSRAPTTSGTSTGSTARLQWYADLGIDEGEAAPAPARRRRAVALREGRDRHRVRVPVRVAGARGHREPHRLRPRRASGGERART